MTAPAAGPLAGAVRPRAGGWLASPLTTHHGEATAQARVLLSLHHPEFAGPLRCLTARYRTATFTVGDPPIMILKRHADQAAYLSEALAYQLLEGEEVLPDLYAACDASQTLITGYLPSLANLAGPAALDELIAAVARVHTAPARWTPPVYDAMRAWSIDEALAGPDPAWITDPCAWRRVLQLAAAVHAPGHVPLGHLDLKAEHARCHADGRLGLIDAETLRPDLTGLPDLITIAHLAREIGSPRPARWIRHCYRAHLREAGAHWADRDLAAALRAFAAGTGLASLHAVDA